MGAFNFDPSQDETGDYEKNYKKQKAVVSGLNRREGNVVGEFEHRDVKSKHRQDAVQRDSCAF